ncbi:MULTISPECIES: GNAT family N-acetyltransferase [unclassified Aureimonas]|uniref:GNAT family N-acetyltransferase n=1 Tax=unclassified Aureimonas TaxID=2615206 RepID=UPI0006F9C044|nr:MULTISPECIES: GNAT family N-acetyltransferase [unclassified Aureimonas]KQT61756.1 GNAT family acetyltransferase [Aureimonas sp. Leaf460]KQT65713.1 GNAT family acetyltransferase [Aureimonas sp. Leaf427]
MEGEIVTAPTTIHLDSFELTATDIAEVPVEVLHAHSIGVRWPHRAEDWQFLRKVGRGIVMQDEIGRPVGSAMWFPYERDFATIGMVITSPRLQTFGTARWMMDHVMRDAGPRTFGLNATSAARRLYLSMGFQAEATLYQCNAVSRRPPDGPLPPGATLRGIEASDLPALAALDAQAFGAGRAALLAKLFEVSKGVALVRDGRIEAFALCRRFGRGHVIGPVVAATDEDAIAVVRPHAADQAGRFLRLDTRERDGAFFAFLAECGLSVYDTVTTMALGGTWVGAPRPGSPRTYAVAAQALG